MPRPTPRRAVRKAVSAIAGLAVAFQPMLAQAEFYYRNIGPRVGHQTPKPDLPVPDTNQVPGTGDLSVLAATSVRARPGVSFSFAPSVKGGDGEVRWSNVGAALPPGLALSPSTGIIGGRPTDAAAGTYPGILLRATDSAGKTGTTQPITITVAPRPSVSIAAATTVAAGEAIALAPLATDALGSQSWSLSGTLPAGMGFNASTGAIGGASRQGGTVSGLVLSVRDADGAVGSSAPFSITVASSLVIGGLSTSYGTRIDQPAAPIQPSVSGVKGTPAWALASGVLPPGLRLGFGTGAVTGTPTREGTYPGISLQVTDTASNATIQSPPFTITVSRAPAVSLSPLAYFVREGTGISVKPGVSGLVGPVRWILTGGTLPRGLSIDPATGAISGTPEASVSLTGLSLKAVDLHDGSSSGTPPFSITAYAALKLADTAPQTAGVGEAFALSPPEVSNLGGTPRWRLVGALPTGLRLDAETGVVSGTPTEAATSRTLRYEVTDSLDDAKGSGRAFTISVPAPGTVAISGVGSAYVARTGQSFSLRPDVVGAARPLIWTVDALPSWATIDSGTGTISGAPGAAEPTQTVRLTVRDAAGKGVTSAPFTLETRASLRLSYPPVATEQGSRVALDPHVTSAQGTVAYSLLSGNLPNGLSLDPATGRISGAPFETGRFLVSVGARDEAVSAPSNVFAIDVAAGGRSASIPPEPAGQPGRAFSVKAAAEGFQGAVAWSVGSGPLPSWATLDGNEGTIAGVPPAAGYFGPFTLEAADATGTRARTNAFTIVVSQNPVLGATASDAATVVGASFSLKPSAANTRGDVRWTLESGKLPAGLSLDEGTGAIAGVPTEPGVASNLILKVTDAAASAPTKPFSITVADAPALWAAMAVPDLKAVVGRAFASAPLDVRNPRDGYSVSLASGTLPAWASLDATSGAISGTPAGVGDIASTQDLRLSVTDGKGRTATGPSFSLSVTRPPMVASGAVGFVLHPGIAYAGPAPQVRNALGEVAWSVVPGLPSGLSVDRATGAISGTLAAVPAGVGSHELIATDAADGSAVPAGTFQVTALGTPSVEIPENTNLRHDVAGTLTPTASQVALPLRWTLSGGPLPDGLGLDPSSGALSGTPTALGTTSGLRLTVTDAQGVSGTSDPFSISVDNSVHFAFFPVGAYPPPRRVTVPWTSPTPNVVGAIAPVAYELASGAVPPGTTFDGATGMISGTPTGVFAGSVTIKATDATGKSATSSALDVSIGAAPSVSMDDVVVRIGAPVAIAPGIANALPHPESGTYGLALSGGALPDGLRLGFIDFGRTWHLLGSPTTAGSVAGLTLTVSDFNGAYGSSQPFSITVQPGISIAGIRDGYAGRAGQELAIPVEPSVLNGKGKIAWSIDRTPPGLTFDPDTGSLSGTPTAAFSGTVNIKAVDSFDDALAKASASLSIAPAVQVLGAADLTTHVGVGASTRALAVVGQKGTSLGWSSAGTALPDFARLDTGTGIVTLENPALGKTVGVVLRARDNLDGAAGVSQPFALNVIPLPAVGNVSTGYTARLGFPFQSPAPTVTNAIGSTTWGIEGTALPAWARIEADGSISGTPTTPAHLGTTLGHRIVGTDSTRTSASSPAFSIGVYGQPAVTLAASVPSGQLRVGDAYTLTPTAEGLSGPGAWSFEADPGTALPPGIRFAGPATGVVEGTATAPGSATFALTVSDPADGSTGTSAPVTLVASPGLRMAEIPDVTVHANDAFVRTPSQPASGIVGTASYSLSPASVPPGMNPFDTATGVLSGLPSGRLAPTVYIATVRDSFDGRTASTTFTVTVVDALAFTAPVANLTATVGTEASLAPSVGNAIGEVSYALHKAGVAAPDALASCGGLGFSAASGAITGRPGSTCAVGDLTILARDATQTATSTTFSVTVAAPDVTLAVGALTVQEGSSETLQASTNMPSPAWSLSGAPAGSTVSPSGLVTIYGSDVPADAASTVTVTATSGGYSAARSFTATVRAASAALSTPQQVRTGQVFIASAGTTMSAKGAWTVASVPADIPDAAVTGPSSILSGTAPNVTGTSPATRTLTVTYSASAPPQGGVAGTASASATLTVHPRLAAAALALSGNVGTPIAAQAPVLTNRVGTASYVLRKDGADVSASLSATCPGLSFSPLTGLVTGTPSGTCSPTGLTIAVRDDGNGSEALADEAAAPLTLAVAPAAATVSSYAPTLVEGSPLVLSAGTTLPSPTYALAGQPPAWLGIDPVSGAISGTSADVAAETIHEFAVKATSGTYSATSPTVRLTVSPASVTLAAPANLRSGSPTSATVSSNFAAGVSYAFAAFQADGTTPATDVAFSPVSNGAVTITVSAPAGATRHLQATATASSPPSAGVRATAASAKVALAVLAPLNISMGNQSQRTGSTTTLAPTVTGASASATYALLQGGSPNAAALASCGYALNTATGRLTTAGATACNVPGLTMSVTDGGTTVMSSPTFSVIVTGSNVPQAAVTVPNSPGTGQVAQSYPPMQATAPISGGNTTYQAFYDGSDATYATIGVGRGARIAYFYNASGVQLDCMVVKGLPGNYAPVNVYSSFFMVNTQVGTMTGTVQAGKYTQIVSATPIGPTDSMEIYTTAGTVGLSEWRLGNMSGGVCVQPGTGGPVVANFSFSKNPDPLTAPLGSSVSTDATLSGIPSGNVSWAIVDSGGFPAPAWLSTTGCTNSGCTVTAAPTASTQTGTATTYFLTATDASGAVARSTGFAVSVPVPLASATLPNSPKSTTDPSLAQSYPPMTASAPLTGGSSLSMFHDDGQGTYASLSQSGRVAYFWDVAGIQTDCFVLKGAATGGTGTVNLRFALGPNFVGTASASMRQGVFTQHVLATPIAKLDSLDVVAASGTLNMAEFRMGNMVNGTCRQPGSGGPTSSLGYSVQPQPVTVGAGQTMAVTAQLSGTTTGTVSWSVADSTGGAPPAWLTRGTCNNAQCTLNVAPAASTTAGTYPATGGAFHLYATDGATGVQLKSEGFTVRVTPSITAARPVAMYHSAGTIADGSCASSAPGCTGIDVPTLWAANPSSPVVSVTHNQGIEAVFEGPVAVGSMAITFTNSCPSSRCYTRLHYWQNGQWMQVADTNPGYWSGVSTPTKTSAGGTFGAGNVFAQRWRFTFGYDGTPSTGIQYMYRFRFGDSGNAYAP